MRGVITNRDVLLNFRVIWREFGFRCLVKCVWVCLDGRKTTFLDVAFKE
ncbi:MAG: hypothetical protein ACOZIN_20280 [Myxococcota bacterium]